MVAIRQEAVSTEGAARARRIKVFFLCYGAVTLLVPFLVGLSGGAAFYRFFLPLQALILPETSVLLYYVQQGHDDSLKCRLLGFLILLRMVLPPACWIISILLHRM
jgi:hypothetical protein